jgi:hypothetical protein
MRGLLSVMVLWCFVYAVSQLSLANAYSIFMSAPLLITANVVTAASIEEMPRRFVVGMSHATDAVSSVSSGTLHASAGFQLC